MDITAELNRLAATYRSRKRSEICHFGFKECRQFQYGKVRKKMPIAMCSGRAFRPAISTHIREATADAIITATPRSRWRERTTTIVAAKMALTRIKKPTANGPLSSAVRIQARTAAVKTRRGVGL